MDHPNIHQLQGVIMFRDHDLGVVSEWMENGNLLEYLWKQPSADRYYLVSTLGKAELLSLIPFSAWTLHLV